MKESENMILNHQPWFHIVLMLIFLPLFLIIGGEGQGSLPLYSYLQVSSQFNCLLHMFGSVIGSFLQAGHHMSILFNLRISNIETGS